MAQGLEDITARRSVALTYEANTYWSGLNFQIQRDLPLLVNTGIQTHGFDSSDNELQWYIDYNVMFRYRRNLGDYDPWRRAEIQVGGGLGMALTMELNMEEYDMLVTEINYPEELDFSTQPYGSLVIAGTYSLLHANFRCHAGRRGGCYAGAGFRF